MSSNEEYIKLVERARLGDKDSMNRLAELARGRLYAFVYRMTLKEDLSQDIVQESMLEMFKVLGKLKKADRFWPWLYTITYNKIRRHWRNEKRHKAASLGEMELSDRHKESQGGLENLVAEELREVVLSAIKQLKESHRAVLTMRCYENMKYSEIAELMGSSELGTRMLFMRAKKSLEKQLSRRGLSRGALLTALVVFGKMTAFNEAAAAQVTVSAATTNAGLAATVLAHATSKTAITMTVAGTLAVTTAVIVPNGQEKANINGNGSLAAITPVLFDSAAQNKTIEESWYYYPQGPGGSMMMRKMVSDNYGNNSYCQVLQDESKNYLYDRSNNKIHINNFRAWGGDNSVPVLPTDSREFVNFLSQMQKVDPEFRQVSRGGAGLLVIAEYDNSIDTGHQIAMRHSNVLQEDYFKYTWPSNVEFVDNRDLIHKRGWCYFSVEGQLGESKITGSGRLPLFYQVYESQSPWLKLNVNSPQGSYTIVDSDAGGAVINKAREVIASYEAGSFFKGLSRQWLGLHTIDTIRRDAVENRLYFTTDYEKGDVFAVVSVMHPDVTITYTINMEKDFIEKISFFDNTNGSSENLGVMKFTYFDKSQVTTAEFNKPQVKPSRRLLKETEGISWLSYLAKGQLAESVN